MHSLGFYYLFKKIYIIFYLRQSCHHCHHPDQRHLQDHLHRYLRHRHRHRHRHHRHLKQNVKK
jgi:hypothetical protein